MNDNFEFEHNEEDGGEALAAIKTMLVSEIEMIRDGLKIVNMFLGEPAKAMVEFLKVTQAQTENNE